MVLVQVHKFVLRLNQSKVRRYDDPWHDVAIPLNPEPEGSPNGEESEKSADARAGSHPCEGSGHRCSCCYEYEISCHTYTEKRHDFVKITASV